MADAVAAAGPNALTRRQARKAARRAADLERGYSISYKRLSLAFAAEGVIVATSLAGAWLFASIYGGNDPLAFWMMMLAPIAYGVIEFSRVPLAVSIRTQKSLALRIVAAVGVVGAAAVTVKSVSQLGEIMFRPRLQEAVQAHERLVDANNARATLDRKIKDADEVVAQRTAQLEDAERRLKSANTELGALPPQRCWRVTSTTSDGRRVTGTRCSTDPRTEAMKTSLGTAQKDRQDASARLDEARAERAKLDRTAIDRAQSEAEVAFRDAIMRSQLHSFTGMVFFKDPAQVTEKEIHSFLFFFVFIPALGASLASTLLALTSVERLREEDDIVLDPQAGSFILEPFAAEIIRHAREEAERSAAAALDRARPPAPVAPAEPAGPPAPAQAPAAAAQAGGAASASHAAAPGHAPLRVIESGR
ncbi:ATPase [Enterovirga aerilata]|uniref:ATPase n=1 Tax=Enterovirga aerilata TaxID=2730920 RepID=A0A849I1J7_9HYPH|nr:ATPase [Enterovirga sp. DB1703]NNM71218.1 ATPase [Enterovirga sp. DB1703]